MKIFKELEQGSEEWFEERKGLPSGSRLNKIATPRTGKLSAGHKGVIAELIAEQVVADRDDVTSYWMDRGVRMEPEARAWYAFDQDAMVDEVGLIKNHGFCYSPDGLISRNTKLENWYGVLEIKCPKPATHVKWLLEGVIPDEYKPQVYGGLWICEADFADFMSYCPDFPDQPLIVRATPEDDYFDQLIPTLETFLDEYTDAKRRIFGDSV